MRKKRLKQVIEQSRIIGVAKEGEKKGKARKKQLDI